MHNESIEEVITDFAADLIGETLDETEVVKAVSRSETEESYKSTDTPTFPTSESSYPEHAKLTLIADKSQTVGEFVDWLNNTKEIYLAEWHKEPGRRSESVLSYARTNIHTLLAEFFNIDQDKINSEKEQMLELMRKVKVDG